MPMGASFARPDRTPRPSQDPFADLRDHSSGAVGAQWELPGGVGAQWELPGAVGAQLGIAGPYGANRPGSHPLNPGS
jgi:hypothetical protein